MSREQELEALLHYHQNVEQTYHIAIAKANEIATRWEIKAKALERENESLHARMAEGFPVQWEPVSDWAALGLHVEWYGGQIRISLPEGHAIFRRIKEDE